MKKQDLNILSNLLKTGMPLSYFAKTEPFNHWFGLLTKYDSANKLKKGEKQSKVEIKKTKTSEGKSIHWTENVFLEKFQSKEIEKGIFKGCYEIYVEFSAYQKIVISLPNPKGTAAVFGNETKKNEKGEKLKLKFILDSQLGIWKQIQVFGDLRFRLSKNIISKVVEKNNKWLEEENKNLVEVSLSGARLIFNRGAVPKLSSELSLPNYSYRIAQSNLVAKISSLNLGGGLHKPKIIFNNIKLQNINKQ